LRCIALYLGVSPGFVGPVRPMFGGGLYVLELDDALGEWCFGVFPRLGWTPGVLWRISRRLLEFFEELVARGEVEAAVLAALERASGDEEVPPP
jgi:hypothetical protein